MDDPPAQDLMARLAKHRAIGGAPAWEHAWLVAHGELRKYAAGTVLMRKGEQARNMFVLLDGHIVIRTDSGVGAHKVFEWKGGDLGGTLPYSRRAAPPNDAIADADTEMLEVSRDHFPEMIRVCPTVTEILVHAMLDRARMFTSSGLRDEKLISLGKLASGIAHELNNPSSAILRSSKMLAASLSGSEEAARRINGAHLTDAQLDAIDVVREQCTDMRMTGTFSVVARADREEAIAEWMAERGIDDAAAAALSETTVTIEALDGLAAALPTSVLPAALEWIAAGCTVRTLGSEIETAATRMHELVAAIKGFSYMDHAPVPEPVDIRRGLMDTLRLLDSKVRAKSIEVTFDFPGDLPCAFGVGAELNQVWMNLIDNALDAAPERGHVTVSAARDLDRIVVRIVDDGPGVPEEIQGKIFDPFFTTKGVGKGTGLGLDIVRRLLTQHEGSITLESVPGRTEFQVRIPVEKGTHS
jgi:signal transduction histidine kinase